MFNAINMDTLTSDPAKLDDAAKVLRQLADYADAKADAMRCRMVGDAPTAVKLERTLERRYGRLPEWAKW